MTDIDLWINETVQSLKNSGKFDDIVFLKEFQSKPLEVPVKNYLTVVTLETLGKNTLSKLNPGYGKRKDSSKAGFILYSPFNESGYALTQKAMKLYSEISLICSEDEDTPEITLEPIKFDEKADTLYREITVTFTRYSDNSSGSETGNSFIELTVNGMTVENLVDAECIEKKEIFSAETYLTDIPAKRVPFSSVFSVFVRKNGSEADSVFYEPNFTAKLILDGHSRIYSDCTVTLIKTHVVDGGVVTDIEFFGNMEVLEEGESSG